MIKLKPNENDNINFIKIVEQIVNVGVNLTQPQKVFVIKIDHWFDFKWLFFSHKSTGAFGVWDKNLRIPPFIPDRITEELHFQQVSGKYIQKTAKSLHIYQSSEENYVRRLNLVSNSAVFLWFSGQTKNNSQGSLMIYTISKELQNAWYVLFIKKSDWQIHKTKIFLKMKLKL